MRIPSLYDAGLFWPSSIQTQHFFDTFQHEFSRPIFWCHGPPPARPGSCPAGPFPGLSLAWPSTLGEWRASPGPRAASYQEVPIWLSGRPLKNQIFGRAQPWAQIRTLGPLDPRSLGLDMRGPGPAGP